MAVSADERALHRWGHFPSSAPKQGTHDTTKAGKPLHGGYAAG